MKCKNCGSVIKEGAVFCSVCGTRVLVEGLRSKHEISYMNAPIDTRPEILKKKKKKSVGCCGCLFSLLIIILLIFGIVKLVGWYREYSYNKFVEESLLVDKNTKVDLTEEELSQDWNNDGISNEEAEIIGLNVAVSDSDGDGLSDSDEINIYKTNPLKYSTTGDIYSDGHKVALGYDLTKKYETFTILDTVNPNLKVEIDDAHDMNYYYKEYNGLVPDGYYLGFQPFRLFSFKGEIDVILEKPDNYKVISYDLITGEVTNIKSRIENENNLVFTVSDDNPILVVYKDSIVKKLSDTAKADIESKFNNDVKKEYYIVAFPIITVLFNHPVYVFEIDNNIVTSSSDDAFTEEINKQANGQFKIEHYFTNEIGLQFLQGLLGDLTNQLYTNVGEENKSFIDYIVTYRKVSSKSELYEYLFGEFGDDGKEETDDEEKFVDDKYNNMSCTYCADSGFDVGVNAFPFQNLSTKVSSGGVCAGFSSVTTNIYNNSGMSKSISGVYDMSSSSYDLIWNKNLYSYKPSDKELVLYADDKRKNENLLDSSTMSSPDNEVVKAIEYYWEKYNKDTRMTKFSWAWNSSFDSVSLIEESTVNNLIEQFKAGKIVSVSLLQTEGQHAINAYKIVEDKNDPDILYIKAYDNNFPNDMFWNADSSKKVKYDVTIVLKRVYEENWYGTKIKYSYVYNPIGSSSYNYGTYNDTYDGILFIDENNKAL